MENQVWEEETLTLVRRVPAYEGVDTYVFRPARPVQFEAGQYAHVRLSGMPLEERSVREFSFASAPHDEEVWFGVDSRSESSYQRALKNLQPGDTVALFKIKGHMHWPPQDTGEVVMIAGGVGVTPFRSQLRDFVKKDLPLAPTLIHVASGEYLYREEFSKMPIKYIPIRREELSARILECTRQHPLALYYIAGSPGFVHTVLAMLSKCGIRRVEGDEFKGLPD